MQTAAVSQLRLGSSFCHGAVMFLYFLMGWAISQVREVIRLCTIFKTKHCLTLDMMHLYIQTCTTSHLRHVKQKYAVLIQLESDDWQPLQLYMLHFTSLCSRGLDFMNNMLDCSKKTALWHQGEEAPETCSFQNLL